MVVVARVAIFQRQPIPTHRHVIADVNCQHCQTAAKIHLALAAYVQLLAFRLSLFHVSASRLFLPPRPTETANHHQAPDSPHHNNHCHPHRQCG